MNSRKILILIWDRIIVGPNDIESYLDRGIVGLIQ